MAKYPRCYAAPSNLQVRRNLPPQTNKPEVEEEVEGGVADGLQLRRGHAAVALDEEVVGHLEVGLGRGVADVVMDGIEVVEGHEDQVLGVAAQQDLLLHGHHHQVVQLRQGNRF